MTLGKNESNQEPIKLRKMDHTGNNGSILQKLITLRKVGQTWEMVPHVEKWGKLLKMICIWKNGSHLDLTRKNGLYLKKQDALRKMSHI